jgi:hypothetical protein
MKKAENGFLRLLGARAAAPEQSRRRPSPVARKCGSRLPVGATSLRKTGASFFRNLDPLFVRDKWRLAVCEKLILSNETDN